MKETGFTLIELLGVIVILTVLSLITVPVIDSSLNRGKNNLQNIQKEQIIKALKNYYTENINELNNIPDGGSGCKSISELKTAGYLPLDIKDPKTNENIDDLNICAYKSGKKITYEVIDNT